MPLKNFVLETASAPGTATTVSLIGPATGRMSFVGAGFTSGMTVEYYFMDDGTIFEYGIGTFHSGSPNTLDRTTVLGNSAGTTARLSFAGDTDIYNEIPAERAVYVNSAGTCVIAGNLQVTGSFGQSPVITNKTSAYAIVVADRGTRFTASTAVPFTLPTASSAGAGWSVDLTNNTNRSSPSIVSAARSASDIIDAAGDTIVFILPGETVTFTSTSVAWLTTGRTVRGRTIGATNYASAGGSTQSGTATNLLGTAFTYQPASNASIIDITVVFQGIIGAVVGVATSAFFRVSEVGGAGTLSNEYQIVANSANTELRAGGLVVKYQVANTSIATRSFQLQARSTSAATATGIAVTAIITEFMNG